MDKILDEIDQYAVRLNISATKASQLQDEIAQHASYLKSQSSEIRALRFKVEDVIKKQVEMVYAQAHDKCEEHQTELKAQNKKLTARVEELQNNLRGQRNPEIIELQRQLKNTRKNMMEFWDDLLAARHKIKELEQSNATGNPFMV